MSTIAAVIPAYNAADSIGKTINSVVNQTSPPDEIIVVDDGSTDETAAIAAKLGTIVISQENGGCAKARQTGTLAATTEYIAYLDADDCWKSDTISKFRKAIAENEIYYLFGDFIRSNGKEFFPANSTFFPNAAGLIAATSRECATPNLRKLEPEEANKLFLSGFPAYSSTSLVRKSTAEAIGWDDRFSRCQDFDFILRLSRNLPVHYCDDILSIIGLHPVNEDRERYVRMQTQGDIKVLTAHIAEAPSDAIRRASRRARARKLIGLAMLEQEAGNKKEAWSSFVFAIRSGAKPRSLARFMLQKLTS